MAKKVRRVKKNTQKSKPAVDAAIDPRAVAPETAAAVAARARQTSEEQFHEEYAYVVKDLRNVLMLSAAMFALLIVLNLLLN